MDDSAGGLPLGAVVVPWNVVVPEADVHIVGYGNRLPNEFTLELLAVLQRCTRVFGAPPIDAPEFKVPAMERLVDDPASAVDVDELAEVVVAAASDAPVALALAGSAVVGASGLAHRVATLAAERGLTVHVTNAAPPFDAIWADCNIDPFHGCEIWDAATFVRREIEPAVQAHLLLTEAPTGPEDGATRAARGAPRALLPVRPRAARHPGRRRHRPARACDLAGRRRARRPRRLGRRAGVDGRRAARRAHLV